MKLEIVEAYGRIGDVRALFAEYAASLEIDLCFQHFEEELRTLPGRYAPPDGGLYLALAGVRPAGCVALRSLDGGRCEMKRLYVQRDFRGLGLGRALAGRAIAGARAMGYRQVLLDTLPSMAGAQKLYEALGFRDVPAYYANPCPGARFMALTL